MIQLTRKARDHVVAYVAETHQVPVVGILGKRRVRPLAYARQHVMWILRELGYSYPEIGRALGLDHTSCIHGWRSHQARLDGKPSAYQQKKVRLSTVSPKPSTTPLAKSCDDQRMERFRRSKQNRPPWQVLVSHAQDAAVVAGVTTADVLSTSTDRSTFKARQVAWKALLREGYSPSGIADAWGCTPTSVYRVAQAVE